MRRTIIASIFAVLGIAGVLVVSTDGSDNKDLGQQAAHCRGKIAGIYGCL